MDILCCVRAIAFGAGWVSNDVRVHWHFLACGLGSLNFGLGMNSSKTVSRHWVLIDLIGHGLLHGVTMTWNQSWFTEVYVDFCSNILLL